MKPITLKLADTEFIKLSNLKQRTEIARREVLTWEQFIELLRKNFESILR